MNERSFYQREASRYHQLRYGSWYGSIVAETHNKILSGILSKWSHPGTILDVASGTGHNLGVLSGAGGLVVAGDLTTEMMEAGRKRSGPVRNVAYLQFNAFNLPFPDQIFDVVASSRFLHLLNFSDQERAMLEIFRVLKPGGIVIIDFFNSCHWNILSLPILIYRFLLKKRPRESHLNNMTTTLDWIKRNKIEVLDTIGVGSYFLVLFWLLPRKFTVLAAGLFKKGPLKIVSEQIIVVGRKEG